MRRRFRGLFASQFIKMKLIRLGWCDFKAAVNYGFDKNKESLFGQGRFVPR